MKKSKIENEKRNYVKKRDNEFLADHYDGRSSINGLSCEIYRLLIKEKTLSRIPESLYKIIVSQRYIDFVSVKASICGTFFDNKSKVTSEDHPSKIYTYRMEFCKTDFTNIEIRILSTEINGEVFDRSFRSICNDIQATLSEAIHNYKQKQVDKNIEEQQFFYKSVIDNVHETIMIIQNNRFVFLNKSSYDLGGYTIKELLDKNFSDFIYHEDIPMILEKHRRRLSGEYVPPYDFRFVRKDGEVRWGLISATNIEWKNDIASICFITDITERKQYEHELIKSESKYRSFINHAIEAIFVVCDNKCVYSNPSATVLTGYNEMEINSLVFSELFHEQDRSLLENNMMLRLEGYPISADDYRIIKKNRNLKWGIVNLTKISWQSESAILCFITDITKRKKMEQELQFNEQRYRDYIENSPEGFVAFDDKGRIVEANRSAEYLLSYTKEELKHKTIRDITAREYIEKLHALISEMKDTGTINDEIELVRRNGIRMWVSFSGVQINEERYISFFSNVTMQKHSEQVLKQTQQYLNALVNSMPSAIIGIDTDYKITRLNQLSKTYRTNKSDYILLKDVFSSFIFLKPYKEQIKDSVEKRTKLILNEVYIKQDSIERYVNILVYPISHENNESAVIRIDDITEKVFFERKLIQSEKMSSIGELAAGMAHEINNPLGSIMSGIQNTMRRISTDLPKNIQVAEEIGTDLNVINQYLEERNIFNYLSGISEAASKASHIVANLMNFSRKSQSEYAEYSVYDIVESAIKIVKNDFDISRDYDFCHIKISRNYNHSVGKIFVDFSEIEQVFFNILKNSAQAIYLTKDEIDEPQIIINTYETDDHVVTEICDNGPGIEEDKINRIFEPFYTTKDVGVGTGLGLSVSYFIITKNYNGIINAESIEPKGLKLIIKLPLINKKTE